MGDAALKPVEVAWGTEVGLGPDRHAQLLGQARSEALLAIAVLPDSAGAAAAAWTRSSRSQGRWRKSAVDAGGVGDPGHGDVLTAAQGRIKGVKEAFAAAQQLGNVGLQVGR